MPKNSSFLSMIFFPLFLLLSSSAWAADCTSPAGKEGAIRYNKADKNLLFCNGTDWVSPRDEAKKRCAESGGGTPAPTVTTGPVQCWGTYAQYGAGYGGIAPSPTIIAKSIVSTTDSMCAIKQDSTVQCWGNGSFGILPAPAISAKSLVANSSNVCAIKMDDTVQCWGSTASGIVPAPTISAKSLVASNSSVCAIKMDDTVQCWGTSGYGGDTPSPTITAKSMVAAVGGLMCAIKMDDTVQCWGRLNADNVKFPAAGMPSITAKSVFPGNNAVCIIKPDDTVQCWGNIYSGGATPSPTITAKSISVGGAHMCAMKMDNTVKCWGNNFPDNLAAPVSSAKSLTTGSGSVCAIKMDDTVQCWGPSEYGGNSGISLGISAKSIVTSIAGPHYCAIKMDDTVLCWSGDNTSAFGRNPSPAVSAQSIIVGHNQDVTCAIKKP